MTRGATMRPAEGTLAHRAVVLLHPALLPALLPEAWETAGEAGGARLVRPNRSAADARPFLVAPTEEAPGTMRALASEGAAAFFIAGTCTSPTRALEPGDLLVVDVARTPEGEVRAHASMATKLWNRAERRGLHPHRGAVASGGTQAGSAELAENERLAGALRAGEALGVPTGALLVCAGADAGFSVAPAAVLEGFEHAFGVLQEILGAGRPAGSGASEAPSPMRESEGRGPKRPEP